MIDDVYSLNDFKLPLNDSLENKNILPTAYSIFISYYFQFSLSNLPVNPAYPQSLLISTKFVIDNQVTTL